MTHKSAKVIQEFMSKEPDADAIAVAFALRSLVHTASYPEGYSADESWTQAVIPTKAGNELLARLDSAKFRAADVRQALFGLFWFRDLLVDAPRCDLEKIRAIIHNESIAQRFFWPLRQGRTLYDAYSKHYSGIRDHLSPSEWLPLLSASPQGIYQVGRLVTGPFGVIDSETIRYYPPTSRLGLVHCPLVDCRELHPVRLQPPKAPLTDIYRELETAAAELWVQQSHWDSVLSRWPHGFEDAGQAYSTMPAFLGECIVDQDRTILLTHVLKAQQGEAIRALLKRYGLNYKGSPGDVASSLSGEHQLQLLLALSDGHLKYAIDQAVWTNEIVIPADEVRRARAQAGGDSFELSNLGIREQRSHPILLLRHLIRQSYLSSGELVDLDWRLRKPANVTTDEALAEYLRNAEPSTALDSLVLTSPRVTQAVADALETKIDYPDSRFRARLAWKLGFNLSRDDGRFSGLNFNLDEFAAIVTRLTVPHSEPDRKAIRSAGVNAFVEFEGFTNELVSYLVWLLCSDHPGKTRFIYSRGEASEMVSGILGSELSSGGEVVRWKASGNALGACARYLQQLASWIQALPAADRSALAREPEETNRPQRDDVTFFPFRHLQLWADASPDSLTGLGKLVARCSDLLNKSDVAGVRNGLEHYRDSVAFPTSDRIRACAEGMRAIVALAQEERLVPRPYWIGAVTMDASHQRTFVLRDIDGRTRQIHTPSTIRGHRSISRMGTSLPVLVAPANLLGIPNADLLFRMRSDSSYARYWSNYPNYGPRAVISQREDAEIGVANDRSDEGTAVQPAVAADGTSRRS